MEKYFAVIGNPIAHSLSPVMHQAGYRAMGIDARYVRFKVDSNKLPEAVTGLCSLGFSGWNVTIPHKEGIIRYLDELTPEAERAGAVNTVKFTTGKLIGHNTDGKGFVRSLKGQMPDLKGRLAVIIGAGGAARGIALALMEAGMSLHILNRTPEKALALVQTIRAVGGEASCGELQLGDWLQKADLLVQTTSVGLHGEAFPFELKGISSTALVVDVIFRPWETPFLRNAKAQGCRTLNGLAMLLHQGALAWEFWLEEKAPLKQMWAALLAEVELGKS